MEIALDEPELIIDRNGPVCTIRLNRPERLNSLSLEGIKALLTALEGIALDETVRVLILTGSGRGFCAGWHLDDGGVPGLSDESLGVRQSHLMEEYFNPVIAALHEVPVPTVAAINGICAGAGVSLALATDIAVAARSASFVLTFAPKLGIIPDMGATWKLPRSIGWARAHAVTLLGERITAATAAEWGMIYRVVDDGELGTDVAALAEKLQAAPPRVALEVRRAYHAAQLNSLPAQMDYERLRQRELLDSDAFNEGLRAFRAKREPRFHDQGKAGA